MPEDGLDSVVFEPSLMTELRGIIDLEKARSITVYKCL